MNIDLSVRTGNQFHQLYFALVEQRQAMLREAVKQLGPYDDCLEQFATYIQDVEVIDELLTGMVTALNFAVSNEQKGGDGFNANDCQMNQWSALVSEVKDNFSQTSQPASAMQKGGQKGE